MPKDELHSWPRIASHVHWHLRCRPILLVDDISATRCLQCHYSTLLGNHAVELETKGSERGVEGVLLEQISSKQLRDDLMTMLIAGHETTAAVLTWTMYCLTKHPDYISRIQAEVSLLCRGSWRNPILHCSQHKWLLALAQASCYIRCKSAQTGTVLIVPQHRQMKIQVSYWATSAYKNLTNSSLM